MNHPLLRRGLRAAVLTAVLTAALGATAAAWADPPARVGRVAWLAGSATLTAQPGALPEAAALNWPVTSGNVLTTSPSGRAEVSIGSAVFDLDVDTEVDVEALDDAQLRLRVVRGSLAVRTADPQDAATLDIETPLGRVSQPRPGSARVDVRAGSQDVTAWRGSLGFAGPSNRFTFAQGQHARLVPAAGGGLTVTMPPPAQDDFAQVAQARTGAPVVPAGRPVSPQMTGADVLDRYGQWQQTPDYGSVWVPAVAADWAPYRYGHWAWVAPWGWTWVDDAPWGFAPFHYGRWALWQGRWAWVPGTYVARPVYAPALVAWTGAAPPAPGVSVSITVGSHVGWVPLAPHEVYVPPYPVSTTYVRNVNITHVTNVTEIEHVTRIVHETPAGSVPARPLALAQEPRAVTHVPMQVLAARQPVAVHALPPHVEPAHAPVPTAVRPPPVAAAPATVRPPPAVVHAPPLAPPPPVPMAQHHEPPRPDLAREEAARHEEAVREEQRREEARDARRPER